MFVSLCNKRIQLKSSIPAVCADWRDIFALHHISNDTSHPADLADLTIEAHPLNQAPSIDPTRPSQTFSAPSGEYVLAHTITGRTWLKLASGAIICLPNLNQPLPTQPTAQLFISQKLITYGQVEDASLALLAPIFRRFNIYIIHAFGAVYPQKSAACLIIGPSGSGKTTSGLALICAGWHYLGNDAIFLSRQQNRIVGWPSPGRINLHPSTISLLGNPAFIPKLPSTTPDGKHHFSAEKLAITHPAPTKITRLLFPQISQETGPCKFKQVPAAIALSKLMEQSLDHWDKQTFGSHLSFLQELVSQAASGTVQATADLPSFTQQLNELI